jgi:hypothetical protein
LASHADFWIVAGTAAPVIALAAVLVWRDSTSLTPKQLPRNLASGRISLVSGFIAAVTVAAQAVVLGDSLSYLRTGHADAHVSAGACEALEVWGVIAVAVSTSLVVIASMKAEDEDEKARKTEDGELA